MTQLGNVYNHDIHNQPGRWYITNFIKATAIKVISTNSFILLFLSLLSHLLLKKLEVELFRLWPLPLPAATPAVAFPIAAFRRKLWKVNRLPRNSLSLEHLLFVGVGGTFSDFSLPLPLLLLPFVLFTPLPPFSQLLLWP